MTKSVLVTGGAGYIGSHTACKLLDSGHQVVVLDNLSTGFKSVVPAAAVFYEGDVSDCDLLVQIINDHEIEEIVHFAAHLLVPESVEKPLMYYRNNVLASQNLIQTAVNTGIKHFIFSSTCAVYGMVETFPVNEEQPMMPISPYGRTKCVTEWSLEDINNAIKLGQVRADFSYVALRYFNVAGARIDGQLGQVTQNTTHLVKVCVEAALGYREQVTVFGTDYPTADGTCIRDYIHVDDLANAHIDALKYLRRGGDSNVFNCGYGHGYSVREVIDVVKKVSGVDFKVVEGDRREGDPPAIAADNTKIMTTLNWKPQYDDIELICQSALEWEKKIRA